MTEIYNVQIIRVYEKYTKNSSQVSLEKTVGFISKVDEARKVLEKLYNSN
jgi:hypothetical protein